MKFSYDLLYYDYWDLITKFCPGSTKLNAPSYLYVLKIKKNIYIFNVQKYFFLFHFSSSSIIVCYEYELNTKFFFYKLWVSFRHWSLDLSKTIPIPYGPLLSKKFKYLRGALCLILLSNQETSVGFISY